MIKLVHIKRTLLSELLSNSKNVNIICEFSICKFKQIVGLFITLIFDMMALFPKIEVEMLLGILVLTAIIKGIFSGGYCIGSERRP